MAASDRVVFWNTFSLIFIRLVSFLSLLLAGTVALNHSQYNSIPIIYHIN